MSTTQSISDANKRRHPRLPLHLNVMLIQEGRRPRGCRVLNVSEGGMFLRWSSASTSEGGPHAADQFRRNEAVEIRFSYRSPTGRKDISLPATVRRIEGEGIGVAFDANDQAINAMISNHLDSTDATQDTLQQTVTDSISDSALDMTLPLTDKDAHNDDIVDGTGNSDNLLSSLDADLDDAMDDYISPARSDSLSSPETTATDIPSVEQIEEDLLARLPMPDYARTERLEQRVLTVGLLTFFFGLAALMSTGAYFHNTKVQIQDLRASLGKAVEHMQSAPATAAPTNVYEGINNTLAELSLQITQVSEDLARIEQKVDEVPAVTVALPPSAVEPLIPPDQTTSPVPSPVVAETPTVAENAQTETANLQAEATQQAALSEAQPTPTETQPVDNSADANSWAISLVALRNKDAADRLAQKAESMGIPITVEHKGNDEKPLYQLKILGLDTEAEATAYAKEVEAKLGLSGTQVQRID